MLVKMTSSKQPIIDVLFMGAARVGKSAIIQRLLGNNFSSDYEETVFEYYKHYFDMQGKHEDKRKICLNISDTSGVYQFPAMDRLAIQRANVIVLVFDLTCPQSFHHTDKLATKIEEQAPKTPVIFVGNKSELSQSLSNSEEIEDYVVCTLNHAYVEMSAKYDENANKLLKRIYEEHEIAIGPYSVRKNKRNTISKMKRKLSKSCRNLIWTNEKSCL